MALMDILSSLLSPGQTAGAFSPGQSNAPGGQSNFPISELIAQATQRVNPDPSATSVDPLTVQAPPRGPAPQRISMVPTQSPGPMGPGISFSPDNSQLSQSPQTDYNNSQDVAAAQAAMQASPPQGGMANPGLYGLLPANLQHGVLRNTLGAIGDALLVSGGRQPVYEQRMQRQEIGNAMAGVDLNDPKSVQAAMGRLGVTGATGAPEMIDKVATQAEQAALRKQYMQYNQDYRQQLIDYRNQNMIRQAAPQMQYYLAQAKSQQDYEQRLAYVQSRIKAIDPNADVTEELDVPAANEWHPGMLNQLGMTANQGQLSSDRAASRAVSVSNNANTSAARVRAAQINAGGHIGAAQVSANRPSESNFLNDYISKVHAGQPTTPEEDQRFMHDTQVSSRSRHVAPRGARTAGPPILTPQQAARLPKGAVFRTTDGRTLVR